MVQAHQTVLDSSFPVVHPQGRSDSDFKVFEVGFAEQGSQFFFVILFFELSDFFSGTAQEEVSMIVVGAQVHFSGMVYHLHVEDIASLGVRDFFVVGLATGGDTIVNHLKSKKIEFDLKCTFFWQLSSVQLS